MEQLLACGPAPGIDGILWEPRPARTLILVLKCVTIVGLIPIGLLLLSSPVVCVLG